MFLHLLTNRRPFTTRLLVAGSLGICLVLLVVWSFHQRQSDGPGAAIRKLTASENVGQRRVTKQNVGEAARQYLQQPGEDQSLMQPDMAARISKPGISGWIKLASAPESETEEREEEEAR